MNKTTLEEIIASDDFFLEKYKYNYETQEEELHGVECIDEDTARFALTARFCNLVSA